MKKERMKNGMKWCFGETDLHQRVNQKTRIRNRAMLIKW